ncbi:hypothetical protein [Pseudomonas chlororaphis]|uniref:hypothetical protein n=1 Tax=Pseudomonas chlororaphis TaxID=587753 RepID=UPI0015DEBBB4|nr:hypothetical protein [Pseudomonas chlororaphis]QLL10859.1 hypothetical protein H0I86_17515 [Pseudomonas chlororaphis subsp. aurantiaca]
MRKLLTCTMVASIVFGPNAVGAAEEKTEIKTTPIIEFYGKHGDNDYKCEFTLTSGNHNFKKNSCPNDDVYSFKIKNPKEGYVIRIEDSPDCDHSEPWASYGIRDPHPPMDPTQRMNVDAGYGLSFGKEIVPGIYARYHKNRNQLTGKVSCVNVVINSRAEIEKENEKITKTQPEQERERVKEAKEYQKSL